MAMTALHRSPFVECMKLMSYWPWTNRPYVCNACCVCIWMCRCQLLVLDKVWDCKLIYFTLMRRFDVSMNILQWLSLLYVDLRVLNVWNGVVLTLAMDKQEVRLYGFVRVLEFGGVNHWCLIKCRVVNLFAPMRYCGVQIYFNVQSWWLLCIDLCLLNIWNGYRVGPGQTASTFVLL